MQTILTTILFFGLIVAAMSIGVIFSDRSLRGSCGGTGKGCACNEQKRKACMAATRDSSA